MSRLVTADASKVSGSEFLEALGLFTPEQRAENYADLQRRCIAAIDRGDTYGYPPLVVAECRKIMAERVALVEVEVLPARQGRGRIAA